MTWPDRPLYGIDAGGSGTSVRAFDGERWNAPPVNPSSVGQDTSNRCLAEIFGRIREHAGRIREHAGRIRESARPAIWLASASVDPATATDETERFAAVARAAGLRAELVVSNDLTPLVLGAPAGAGHVVAVCGTGSGFLATDGRSAPVRVGGCEYLGSDEGSAFDLGLRGLRAAVRGLDGRSQRTALSDLLAAQAGAPVPDLARRLARMPFPKSAVAALAPVVLQAWLGGDPAAAGLVEDAIGELVAGVQAARDAAGVRARDTAGVQAARDAAGVRARDTAGVRAAHDAAEVPPGWRLSVVGGVVTGCPEFLGALAAAAALLGADPVELISDPATAVLGALARLAVTDPIELSDPRIDHDIWHIDLAGPCRAGPAERDD